MGGGEIAPMIFDRGIVLMAIAFPPAPARHGAEYLELSVFVSAVLALDVLSVLVASRQYLGSTARQSGRASGLRPGLA